MSNLGELVRAVTEEDLRPPPKGAKVLKWLHQVVARGLAADRERRWPTMRALLEALAELAREAYGRAGARSGEALAEVESWLRGRRG